MAEIYSVHAREVLDSRGNPTVEVEVRLNDGARGHAMVPSGASTGAAEALELRDGDADRYLGRGVLEAVDNVNAAISRAVHGLPAEDQRQLDEALLRLDGTRNKRRFGANALLGVSMAVARAATASAGLPLYRYLGGPEATELPVPMVNILSGGVHGGGNFDFQDFMVVPLGANSYREALEQAVAVYRAMKDVLVERGVYRAGVADEGGYAPELAANEDAARLMVEAIERAGFRPGTDAAIAIDVAASELFEKGKYRLEKEEKKLDAGDLISYLERLVGAYPVVSIEDGLAEEDWGGWSKLTERLGRRCQLVGDDLFVTSAARLARGIEEGDANAVLVKPNQAGTLSEALEVVELARSEDYKTIASARSGETEDDFLADFAVATRAGQIKIGAVTRSERLAKYNRLLRIAEELGERAEFRGREVFQDWLK